MNNFTAFTNSVRVNDVVLTDFPRLSFETIEIALPNDSIGYISGTHSWTRAKTASDLSPLFGQLFTLENDQYRFEDCIVCRDKQSIYVRHGMIKSC